MFINWIAFFLYSTSAEIILDCFNLSLIKSVLILVSFFRIAIKGGGCSGFQYEFTLAISPDKTSGTDWQKHADEFFYKMKSMGEVRLPGERRHKNRLDKGPRNINEELVNKIKSLS